MDSCKRFGNYQCVGYENEKKLYWLTQCTIQPEITSRKEKEFLNLETDFLESWNSFWWIDVKWDVEGECTRRGNAKNTVQRWELTNIISYRR